MKDEIYRSIKNILDSPESEAIKCKQIAELVYHEETENKNEHELVDILFELYHLFPGKNFSDHIQLKYSNKIIENYHEKIDSYGIWEELFDEEEYDEDLAGDFPEEEDLDFMYNRMFEKLFLYLENETDENLKHKKIGALFMNEKIQFFYPQPEINVLYKLYHCHPFVLLPQDMIIDITGKMTEKFGESSLVYHKFMKKISQDERFKVMWRKLKLSESKESKKITFRQKFKKLLKIRKKN